MPIKILSWNIQNVGADKLQNELDDSQRFAGVGNNVLDYVTKVMTCNKVWHSIPALTSPFDIIVIIELTSGGDTKGAPATGNGPLALHQITGQINTILRSTNFLYTPPLNIGGESVGIIYNSTKLTYTANSAAALKMPYGSYKNPRSVYSVDFVDIASTDTIRVAGLHAPPTNSGRGDKKWRNPVNYCVKLSTLPQLTTTVFDVVLMGDFNCNPNTVYTVRRGVERRPFEALMAAPGDFVTGIPNGTLTSMKTSETAVPGDYRANAYDNIFYKGGAVANSNVIDLIAANPTYGTHFEDVITNYWRVSDHLPVYAEI